jgi:hypothetical protein
MAGADLSILSGYVGVSWILALWSLSTAQCLAQQLQQGGFFVMGGITDTQQF